MKGNDINSNDGDLLHAEHILWWAAAKVTFKKRNRKDLDDRPCKNNKGKK